VVTPKLFGKLTAALLQYATALGGAPGRWGEEQTVHDQLTHHHLTADRFFGTYSEPVRRP
jgi:hypothetical protein